MGYDLHRLEPREGGGGRPLVLGGVKFESDFGPVSHSDGDALLHAITDAILGALGEPDIGEIFPNASPKWRDADSAIFVREAVSRMRRAGFVIENLDATVVLERPKLSPQKDAMRRTVAETLGVDAERVNIKGKTHEGVGALGEGRAVEAHAVVLLTREG